MTWHVKVSGAWQTVTAPQVHAAGAWRAVQQGFVKVAGVWQRFFPLFALPAAAVDTQLDPNPATAQIVFNTNGTGTATGAAGFNWITPAALAPGSYTIRAHVAAGSTPSGSTLDADLALSSARSWLVTQSGPGSTVCSLELTLKDGAGNTVATATCEMEATVDV